MFDKLKTDIKGQTLLGTEKSKHGHTGCVEINTYPPSAGVQHKTSISHRHVDWLESESWFQKSEEMSQ